MPKSPKGKKKLTKAEKEKLKKEEAERKAREEEEAKKLAEEEDAARKEQEKVEEEERRHLENEERKKRKGQLQELEEIWMSNVNTLLDQQATARRNAKWARYMQCDGSPDPSVAGEINTYLSLWREDTKNNDIDTVLKDSDLVLGLIAELEYLLEDSAPEELSESQIAQYKETISELQEALQQKLDVASHYLLCQATELADSETMNLQKVITNSVITLCAWGNLSKNPRIKSYEFEEKDFTFEMSKVLTLSDCAFRVLFTRYDHYSPQCKTYLPRIKVKLPEEQTMVEEPKPEGEGGEGGEEGEQKEGAEEGEKEGEEGELQREETEDVMAALHALSTDNVADKKEEEEPEETPPEEPMEEDYEIPTPEPVEFEDFDGDDDAIDLRANHIMGGIFHFNLLQLPPQPKNVNDWVIRQVLDPPNLNVMEYVVDTNDKDKDKERDPDSKEKKELEKPPVAVIMKLPEDVYFNEEPQVVRWDDKLLQWRLDGFSDHTFNEEARTLAFKTSFFGTMALIQDAHINMPFQSWELRPHGANSALLTIIAAIVEVQIEIQEGQCCLSPAEDRTELQHLAQKWMTPKELIKCMRASGVNVFPEPDSSKYVSIQSKNSVTESRLYQQMALTASTNAYSWSKWNSEVESEEKIVLQGQEHLLDEPLQEEEWGLFLITQKRTTRLKMAEFDETFSDDHAEGTEFHGDLYHMTLELASEEGQQRLRDSTHDFVDCVHQLLNATRLLTYS